MTASRKSFLVVLPVLSCLLGVLALEAGLAWFYPIPFSLEMNMYFEPDPHTGFRHKAVAEGVYRNGIEARANSRGHRDDEVETPKPAGVKRVLVLGDSFTAGANVEQAEAYPQVLERLLDSPTQRVEVVNSGVGGWSAFQYAQYFEHYGREFEPDLIVIGFFVGNDTYIDRFEVADTHTAVRGRRVKRESGDGWFTKLRISLYENSHLARGLTAGASADREFSRTSCDDFGEFFLMTQQARMFNHMAKPPPEGLELMRRNVAELARIRAAAAQFNIPVLTVLFPDENQLNADLQAALIETEVAGRYDWSMPQASLHELLDAQDLRWLDLLEPFDTDPRCLYMNDTHWIAAGHEFVAERIRDYILAYEML